MSCSTYILYIYYTYYMLYTILYILYTMHTIYYTIHSTYYNIWYIYDNYIYHQPFAFPDLRLWKAQHLRQRRQLVLRVALVARTAQRRPRHRVGKSWGNRWGNRWETVGKVGKHHGKCPQSLKMVENPSVFALRQFLRWWWFSHWFMETPGLWKWPGQNGHFFFTFTSILQPSGNGKPSKGPEKRMKPWCRSSRRYLPGDERWQHMATISSRYPWFSINCSATKPRKMKLIKEDCSPRCGNFISF